MAKKIFKTRVCKKCGKRKNLKDGFYQDKGGYRWACKDCIKKYGAHYKRTVLKPINTTCGVCGLTRKVRKDKAGRLCSSCSQRRPIKKSSQSIIPGFRRSAWGRYYVIALYPGDKFYKEMGRKTQKGTIRPASEHRYVMALHLGRPLSSEEVVHHIDGNPKNNNLSNLELCASQAEHINLHKEREP
jgi:hypothetical protein